MTFSFIKIRCAALAVGLLSLLLAVPAQAQTMVRVHTTQGPIDISLLDAAAPITVSNFMAYVSAGNYSDVIFHRSVANFIIQSGGFRWPEAAPCCTPVSSRGQIQNEFSTDRPNVRGTVAMAKVGGNPNSATSQWFVNLIDNTTTLGAGNNGGFTVFGRVTAAGMAVVDKIAALPIINAGSQYSELPVVDWTNGNLVLRENVVRIQQVTVLPAINNQTESDRIFNYLEAAYPQVLGSVPTTSGVFEGYDFRYYATQDAYVGTKDGRLWALVPSLAAGIQDLGPVIDWLSLAGTAGY